MTVKFDKTESNMNTFYYTYDDGVTHISVEIPSWVDKHEGYVKDLLKDHFCREIKVEIND